MNILKFLNLQISKNDIITIAVMTGTLKNYTIEDEESEKKLKVDALVYDKFFLSIKDELFPHGKKDEFEYPEPPSQWNEGVFTINVTRCTDCKNH